MILETIGVGFVFAAAALFYERQMDVLYGPYIEGCVKDGAGLVNLLESARAVANGLRWKAVNMAYVASVIAF
jgi:hypothetical protein